MDKLKLKNKGKDFITKNRTKLALDKFNASMSASKGELPEFQREGENNKVYFQEDGSDDEFERSQTKLVFQSRIIDDYQIKGAKQSVADPYCGRFSVTKKEFNEYQKCANFSKTRVTTTIPMKSAPACTMGVKYAHGSSFGKPVKAPGPADYVDQMKNKTVAPRMTFGNANRNELQKLNVPGPGTYKIAPRIGGLAAFDSSLRKLHCVGDPVYTYQDKKNGDKAPLNWKYI